MNLRISGADGKGDTSPTKLILILFGVIGPGGGRYCWNTLCSGIEPIITSTGTTKRVDILDGLMCS